MSRSGAVHLPATEPSKQERWQRNVLPAAASRTVPPRCMAASHSLEFNSMLPPSLAGSFQIRSTGQLSQPVCYSNNQRQTICCTIHETGSRSANQALSNRSTAARKSTPIKRLLMPSNLLSVSIIIQPREPVKVSLQNWRNVKGESNQFCMFVLN